RALGAEPRPGARTPEQRDRDRAGAGQREVRRERRADPAERPERGTGDAPDRIGGKNAREPSVCALWKALEHAEHDSEPEPAGPDPLDEPRHDVDGQAAADDEAEVADHHERERCGEYGGRMTTLET